MPEPLFNPLVLHVAVPGLPTKKQFPVCPDVCSSLRCRPDDIIGVMTKLMEKAVEALRSLPEEQQDAVAGFVLSEIESDRQWSASSLRHADKLRKLADEAREDLRAGRASELDPERL